MSCLWSSFSCFSIHFTHILFWSVLIGFWYAYQARIPGGNVGPMRPNGMMHIGTQNHLQSILAKWKPQQNLPQTQISWFHLVSWLSHPHVWGLTSICRCKLHKITIWTPHVRGLKTLSWVLKPNLPPGKNSELSWTIPRARWWGKSQRPRWHLRQQAPRICTGGARHLLQQPQSSLFVALAPMDLWRKGCPLDGIGWNWVIIRTNQQLSIYIYLLYCTHWSSRILGTDHRSLDAERLPFFGAFSGPGGLGCHEVQGRHPTVRVTQGQVTAGLSQWANPLRGPGQNLIPWCPDW